MTETGTVLQVANLSRRFYGRKEFAVEDVSFCVRTGEFLVISGANGSGKSVLMHLIAGLDEPTSGTVTLSGARVGLVFQNPDAQILGDTPLEDVSFGPRNLGQDRKTAAQTAHRALAEAGLAEKEDHPARALSGGEKRRLAVAGIMAMDADLVIFDEPYANLDWPGVLQVNSILRDLRKSGKTVIVLTHELEKILARADRLLVLHKGLLVWEGKPDQAVSEAPLENWGIRNPLRSYRSVEDLVWEDAP